MSGVVNENYRALMRFEIDRAEEYYKAAQGGIAMLSDVARFPTQAALEIYRQILFRLVDNDYDNLTKRAYVSKTDKFMMLPGIWWKSFTTQPDTPESVLGESVLGKSCGCETETPCSGGGPGAGTAQFSRPDA
jgi:hypothetical protein